MLFNKCFTYYQSEKDTKVKGIFNFENVDGTVFLTGDKTKSRNFKYLCLFIPRNSIESC